MPKTELQSRYKFYIMKKLIIVFISLLAQQYLLAQGSENFIGKAFSKSVGPYKSSSYSNSISTWGLYGIGNVNTESFNNLNSSGKLSGFIRPFRSDYSYGTINFSFNVNASNNDSLLANTFLFPDVGQSSIFLNTEYSVVWHTITGYHLLHSFAELSSKTIKGRIEDSVRYFNTLNWALGIRYQYLFKDGDDNVSFSCSPFLSIVNVPDEDNEDYRYLFTKDSNSSLKSAIKSIGFKFAFQYNQFQFFADLRHVLGNESQIPVRALRGFNSNVGVIFNAQIFEK